jgi:hypothetical protein
MISVLTVGNFANTLSGGVSWNGRDIIDTQTSTIVGLVGESINDVLVVVNSLVSSFVETSLLGCLER